MRSSLLLVPVLLLGGTPLLTADILYSVTDLGSLGGNTSTGYSINNAGQVMGIVNRHAFLYSNGIMTDLNSLIDPNLQLTLTAATATNDLGQIVANGDDNRAYLLTPVPEPGAWALFGVSGLLWLEERRCAQKLFGA